MLVTLGDLVDDVVVRLDGPINVASDTDARIVHRRGGSAANVAACAARAGGSRFVGQVGDDATGAWLVGELATVGVDVSHIRRSGRSASIVVLVDATGERTMLVDPGSSRSLDRPDPAWLDGAGVLHLTLYSLIDQPIATTAVTVAAMAHRAGVPVTVDVSSVALIERLGPVETAERVRELKPTLVFANADEAVALGGVLDDVVMIEKRGPEPCLIRRPGTARETVEAPPLDDVADTTGAGDAFAAGVLTTTGWSTDLARACQEGHRSAQRLLLERSTDR